MTLSARALADASESRIANGAALFMDLLLIADGDLLHPSRCRLRGFLAGMITTATREFQPRRRRGCRTSVEITRLALMANAMHVDQFSRRVDFVQGDRKSTRLNSS